MKSYIILIVLCAVTMICVPLAVLKPQSSAPKNTETRAKTEKKTNNTTTEKENKEQTIAVFRSSTQTTEKIDMFEYICGSVAAEMPLEYHEEALKAQAITCYTNALRLKSSQATEKGDITDDTATHQGYIDKAQRKEKWGKDFEKYEKKLENAVKEVENLALYYDNELCVAAFFAISNGKTENAENIWHTKVPYLISVNSSGDKTAKGYATTVSYSTDDFYSCLKKLNKEAKKPESLKNIIKITEKSDAGTVLEATVNSKEYTGEEIRKAFALRSPTFTVTATKTSLTFTVHGYGHGVGMSQHGANYYANEGYNYEEILLHYYTDAEIR